MALHTRILAVFFRYIPMLVDERGFIELIVLPAEDGLEDAGLWRVDQFVAGDERADETGCNDEDLGLLP